MKLNQKIADALSAGDQAILECALQELAVEPLKSRARFRQTQIQNILCERPDHRTVEEP